MGVAFGVGRFGAFFMPILSILFQNLEGNLMFPFYIFAFLLLISGFLMIFIPYETQGEPLDDYTE